jgi:probable rRNA maturation factor
MADINFFSEDIAIPDFIKEDSLSKNLISIADSYDSTIESLSYIFCSDEYLLRINQEHLDHDYYTDIITFPYQQGKIIEGDIFISLDRVKDNAKELNIDFQFEMYRVISHGLLHLIGFKDKTDEESLEMRKAEDEAISILKH